MKVLLATKETQGQRKNDFNWCNENEIVTFSNVCDSGKIDDSCGCRRSMSGVNTLKATTTMKVVDINSTPEQLESIIAESWRKGGWEKLMGAVKVKEIAGRDTKDICKIANCFKVGTIIEKRGSRFLARK